MRRNAEDDRRCGFGVIGFAGSARSGHAAMNGAGAGKRIGTGSSAAIGASDSAAVGREGTDDAPGAPGTALFARVVVVHRGPQVERDLLEYAAWVATLSDSSVHLLVAPHEGLLRTFAGTARGLFARHGVTRVSMTTLVDRALDEVFEAAEAHDANLLLMRAARAWRDGRRIAARLWTDSPCSVWTVPPGAPPGAARALADISSPTHAAALLTHAAQVCRRAGSDDLVAFQSAFRDVRMSDEEVDGRLRHERLLALYRLFARLPLHGVPCTPLIDESPRIHRALLRGVRTHDADLLITCPEAHTPGSWPTTRREIVDFVTGCEVPLLMLRLSRRREGALDRLRARLLPTSSR